MSNRTKLILTCLPFVLAGGAFLLRAHFGKSMQHKLRSEWITRPIRAWSEDTQRVNATHIVRRVSCNGAKAKALVETQQWLTGLVWNPFDWFEIGNIRLLFEATPGAKRSHRFKNELIVADELMENHSPTKVPPEAFRSPASSTLYQNGGGGGPPAALLIKGGTAITFLGHEFTIVRFALHIDGREFPLDGPPTAVVLSQQTRITEVHELQ